RGFSVVAVYKLRNFGLGIVVPTKAIAGESWAGLLLGSLDVRFVRAAALPFDSGCDLARRGVRNAIHCRLFHACGLALGNVSGSLGEIHAGIGRDLSSLCRCRQEPAALLGAGLLAALRGLGRGAVVC